MLESLKLELIGMAEEKLAFNDPAHDFSHAIRVLKNAEYISSIEGGDLDIIIPAALFHDAICYPKNSPKSFNSANESAKWAASTLRSIYSYPNCKIKDVYTAINECSFSKKMTPQSLESKILQDADRLEATGSIAIMRTFASAGTMNTKLLHPLDPFCSKREPNGMEYALDIFYTRLFKMKDIMHTSTGKALAQERTMILYEFIKNLKRELLI